MFFFFFLLFDSMIVLQGLVFLLLKKEERLVVFVCALSLSLKERAHTNVKANIPEYSEQFLSIFSQIKILSKKYIFTDR